LVGSALFIKANQPTGTLAAMSAFILVYQIFIGGAFWVYLGEVGSEVCLGIGLFSLQATITMITFVTPLLILGNNPFGVANTFEMLGGMQLLTAISLCIIMKESKGLS
jgi:hypothetical protein